jgi:protein-S-isoprenylcysteine O-methyltransferase Ste14
MVMAVLCHTMFAAAVGSMAVALATGLQLGRARPGPWAIAADVLLLLQFPIVHSLLLTGPGRRLLAALSPVGHGRTLAITTYAILSSAQLLSTFWLWSPSGIVWHRASGWTGIGQWALFVGAWAFLQKALWDAGLAVHSGAAGWLALLRGRAIDWGRLPTTGLFALCRQPIYLGFALVLWTAPVWTPDWLALTLVWSLYCVVGPRWKEARWERQFGLRFVAYRETVPYLLPRMFR